MTIPMYLAWNGFPTCKLHRVIRQQIFLIHCAPSSGSSPVWLTRKNLPSGTICIHLQCYIHQILLFVGHGVFKTATKPDESLQLKCNELQLIPNINNQDSCAELARVNENTNALWHDSTNKKCSLQHCSQSNNISVTADPSVKSSIMLKATFYPRGEFADNHMKSVEQCHLEMQ